MYPPCVMRPFIKILIGRQAKTSKKTTTKRERTKNKRLASPQFPPRKFKQVSQANQMNVNLSSARLGPSRVRGVGGIVLVTLEKRLLLRQCLCF